MPDPSNFGEFRNAVRELEQLLGESIEISRLVGENGVPVITHKPPLSSWIEDIYLDDLRNDVRARTYGMCRLFVLIEDLKILASYSQALHQGFQERYRTVTENEFWGWRFELDIATTLISKQIPFSLGVDLPGGDASNGDIVTGSIAIECTSSHVGKSRPFSQYLYKLGRTIRDKSKKPYAKNAAALFIDITSLFFHRAFCGIPIEDAELRSYTRTLLHKTNFGSVVYSLWFVNEETAQLQNLFIREDHDQISPRLEVFLNDDFGLRQSLSPLKRFTAFRNY